MNKKVRNIPFSIIFFATFFLTACNLGAQQEADDPVPPVSEPVPSAEDSQGLGTYRSQELGISFQYPSDFGEAKENRYKGNELTVVKFIDSAGNPTELELDPTEYSMPLSCDDFPIDGFTSGDIMTKDCEALTVDGGHAVLLVTSAQTVMNGETGQGVLFETKKGVWAMSAPEENLISIAKTLKYELGPVSDAEPVIEVATPLIEESEITTTGDLQTYKNEFFEISYPAAWTIDLESEKNGSIYILTKEREEMLKANAGPPVSVYDVLVRMYPTASWLPNNDQDTLSFEAWIAQKAQDFGFVEREPIVIDGFNGYKGISQGLTSGNYMQYVEKDGRIYHVFVDGNPTEEKMAIVESFRFTN